MTAPRTAARLALTAAAATLWLGSAGCQVAPLPEGYSWSGKPANGLAYTPRKAGSYRSGFNPGRVDRSNASTNAGGRAYNFASALGDTQTRGDAGPAEPAPADLSPPSATPATPNALQDLYAGLPAEDPAMQLFASPAASPGYEVRIAPTPVTGRDRGVATHTVARGDSLWRIAERVYGDGLRYQDILRANPGINPDRLTVGDRLVLPGIAPAR